ncbi:MAG TPA: LON peptidase substrate-binding domain-containing protein, partial [Bdellovibrionota bacterium]|nr:LON peptidase substrate-binding domain-containing protein [Bdellovibrionota bacterium]
MDPLPQLLPVLPIRNAVLFPSISMPLVVGRDRSIRALEAAEAGDNLLLIVAQRILTTGDPEVEDLYSVGTLCRLENVISSD